MQQKNTRLPFDPPRYTFDDYKNWSDEWELIDGYPYSLMPSAKRNHQRLNLPVHLTGWKYYSW